MKATVAWGAAILAIIALLYVATVPNGAPPEMTDADRAAIAEQVMAAAHEGFAAAAVNDMENARESWVADPGVYFVGDPAMYFNRLILLPDAEAIMEYWAPSQETRSGTNLMPTEEYVAVLSPTAALYVYTGDWEVLDLEGNVSAQGPITVTTLYVNEGGAWKQLHYHQSWDNAEVEVTEGEAAGG